jgi:hypothetical protein
MQIVTDNWGMINKLMSEIKPFYTNVIYVHPSLYMVCLKTESRRKWRKKLNQASTLRRVHRKALKRSKYQPRPHWSEREAR